MAQHLINALLANEIDGFDEDPNEENVRQHYRDCFVQLCEGIETNDPKVRSFDWSESYSILQGYLAHQGESKPPNYEEDKDEASLLAIIKALRNNQTLEIVRLSEIIELEPHGEAASNITYFLSNTHRLRRLDISVPLEPTSRARDFIEDVLEGISHSKLNELQFEAFGAGGDDDPSQSIPLAEYIATTQSLETLTIRMAGQSTETSSTFTSTDLSNLSAALRVNCSIKNLSLNSIAFGALGIHAKVLKTSFSVLSNHPTLTSIEIASAEYDNRDGPLLSPLVYWYQQMFQLKNKTLERLVLLGTGHAPEAFESLCKFLKCSNCTNFQFRNSTITMSATTQLADLLASSHPLTTLVLGYNRLTSEAGAVIARSLPMNTTLTKLCLENGRILECEAVGESWKQLLRKNTTLRDIEISDLFCNRISYVALNKLIEGLSHNSSLHRFVVSGSFHRHGRIEERISPISNPVWETLANGLNPSITHGGMCRIKELKLHDLVGFSDSDWLPLAEEMKHNTCLETLELVGMGMIDETLRTLASSLTYNTTPKTLNLSENSTIDAFEPFIDNVESLSSLRTFEFAEYMDNERSQEHNSRWLGLAKRLALRLEANWSLCNISFSDELNRSERFYLDLNRNGRYLLRPTTGTTERKHIPLGLWSWIFARLNESDTVHFLHYFLHRKIDLLATVRSNKSYQRRLSGDSDPVEPSSSKQHRSV